MKKSIRIPMGMIALGSFIPLGCTEIDREFFLARNWSIPKVISEGQVRTFSIKDGEADTLMSETSLDSVFDFGNPGLVATFREDGTYSLSPFPSPLINLILSDTSGTWDLEGNALILVGEMTGKRSDFRLVEYGNEQAEMVHDERSENLFPVSARIRIREQRVSVSLVATPK